MGQHMPLSCMGYLMSMVSPHELNRINQSDGIVRYAALWSDHRGQKTFRCTLGMQVQTAGFVHTLRVMRVAVPSLSA